MSHLPTQPQLCAARLIVPWISGSWPHCHRASRCKPDNNRPKEYLERFTLDSLVMVGSLERSGQDWTLIKDPDGGIHRVQVGNFLGRDHGKIVEMGDTFVAVIEIVPDGTEDGWVERPRTIELSGM
jgi:type IV pilus assembly protein PilP